MCGRQRGRKCCAQSGGHGPDLCRARSGLYTPQFPTDDAGGNRRHHLSSLDNLIVNETNLHDMSQNGASRQSTSGDQFSACATSIWARTSEPGSLPHWRGAKATTAVNWMFLADSRSASSERLVRRGVFGNFTVPSRLLYSRNLPIYSTRRIGAPVMANGTVYVLGSGLP